MKTKDKLIGGGILAAVAAAAAYLLLGKDGDKNRELLAGWGIKVKDRLKEELAEIQRTTPREPPKDQLL